VACRRVAEGTAVGHDVKDARWRADLLSRRAIVAALVLFHLRDGLLERAEPR
jgi:hypothetical protein